MPSAVKRDSHGANVAENSSCSLPRGRRAETGRLVKIAAGTIANPAAPAPRQVRPHPPERVSRISLRSAAPYETAKPRLPDTISDAGGTAKIGAEGIERNAEKGPTSDPPPPTSVYSPGSRKGGAGGEVT